MFLTITTEDDRVATIEVSATDTMKNIKTVIESKTNIPDPRQMLFFNGKAVADDATVSGEGMADYDVILVRQRPAQSPAQPFSGAREGMQLQDIPANCSAQLLLDIMEKNPRLFTQLESHNPELAEALKTKNEASVRMALMIQQMKVAKQRFDENQELQQLSMDPMNPEAQAKIAERIRLGNVQQNMEMAMEEMPEAFGRVHMLYIPCEVNGNMVKAFVDSGAQSTIMSSGCAERCGIMRLVDKRFAGQAVGVGTAKIIGRVHMASLKIGNEFYNCSFTILDQQDVDFLFGLDMLKRHQCCIDLRRNLLSLEATKGHQEVPFLPEHEIPVNEREQTLRKASNSAPPSSSTGESSGSAMPSDRQQKVQQLVTMGFDVSMATQALESCNWSVEMAAGLLFESQS